MYSQQCTQYLFMNTVWLGICAQLVVHKLLNYLVMFLGITMDLPPDIFEKRFVKDYLVLSERQISLVLMIIIFLNFKTYSQYENFLAYLLRRVHI